MTPAGTVERRAGDLARSWAHEAIELGRSMAANGIEASQKGAAFDMVTPADGAIERLLRDHVARSFPDHTFLGEEGGGDWDAPGWQWIVDPIDGTLNYATGLPGATTSIALARDGEPVVGVVGDLTSGLVHDAQATTGEIHRSGPDGTSVVRPAHTPIGSSRVFLEWGWEDLDEVMVGTLSSLSQQGARVVRMVGGAAYALLHVALNGGSFLGIGLRSWDIAGGVVLAREAGLATRIWRDGHRVSVVAGTQEDVQKLGGIVETVGPRRVAGMVEPGA